MLSLILNLSTWVIIGLSLSFCATWHNFRPICPTLIIVKWWNGPTATDKRQRERGREERREWNLTSDVLSWLTEAWQRRDQACHSAVDTQMSMKMNSHSRFLWLAPTLSMNITYLAFASSPPSFIITPVHFPIASDSAALPAFLNFFAECKRGDICYLTLQQLPSKSQLTLNGFKWCTQMFNDVQTSDVQCFIPLKLLNHSSLLAYSEERT